MTRIRRISHWETIVAGIVAHYRRLDAACDAALNAGVMDPNGPLFEAIWKSFESMLALLDVDDWIIWFIHENACGDKALEAKGCGKGPRRPVKTCRDLARLIVESEEHG